MCLCEPGQNHTQGLFHFIHCNLCCCGAATVGVFQPVDIERAGTVGVEVGKRLGAARFLTDTCGLLEQLDLGVVLGPLAHDPVGVYLLSDQDDGGVLNNLLVELARCEALRVVASLDELVSYVFVDAVADEGAGSCAGEDPLVFQTVLGGKVLGDDLAGCAAGDVAGADEDSFEGAVAARAAGTVEGFGGELEQRGALASGVSSGGGLYVSCALVVGFFGVGELFGIDRGRVVVAHADDAGAGGLAVYVEDVAGGGLDVGVGEGLCGDGCSAVGTELFLGSDFLAGYLGGGTDFVVFDGFAERTVGGDGTAGYPAAVLARQFGVALNEGTDSVGNICGGRSNGRRVLLSGFCGVGFVLGGAPRVLVLEGLSGWLNE